MLDRLPTELLLAIIELTLPPDDAYSRNGERAKALKSYCLVSQELRKVAQAVLQRVFRPRVNAVRALSQPGLVQNVRILQAQEGTIGFDTLFAVVAKMKELRDVRIGPYAEKVAPKQLRLLGGVEHLVLRYVELDPQGVTFENLTTLTLHAVANFRKGPFVLSPLDLPNLRVLYTTSVVYNPDADCQVLCDLPDLQFQLDFLQVHLDNLCEVPSDLFDRQLPVLFAFNPTCKNLFKPHVLSRRIKHYHFELQRPKFPHLSPNPYPQELSDPEQHFQLLTSIIHNNPQLMTLSLPAPLRPPPSSSQPPLVDPRNRQWLRDRDYFFLMCEAAGVEFLWRLDALNADADLGVNREFWSYAKELKAKKRLVEADVGAEAKANGTASTSGGAA
ncbi:hypothetical protein JCM6882_004964 [Rhodosporidiobolus microsporus]